MTVIWCAAAAAVSAFLAVMVTKRHYDRKISDLAGMLEDFVNGKPVDFPELEEGVDSRIAFLLRRIQEEILSIARREKAENNQVKGLISDISHQLRTPLANIRMYEELLEDTGLSEKERAYFLNNIREEEVKCEWLLKNLLNASRLEYGAIEFTAAPAYIKKTIKEAIRDVSHLTRGKDIRVELAEFEDLKVLHNCRWTKEAFVNILENAVKYSPAGSTIRVAVKREVSYVCISFGDEGIGIPKEERAHIFERFYRCRNVKEESGSGLGLYLVRLILLKENGSIAVESGEGRGSVFRVYLKCG